MKKNKLKRLDTNRGRAYVLEENGKISFLPSVTSILSLKSSQYLVDLEEKIGKEELQEISHRAALRGTAMHSFLENYLICLQKKGDKNSCLLYTQRKSTDLLLNEMEKERVADGRSLFYNIYHSGILDKIKKVIFTEQFLYSKKYLFAGTTDFGFIDTGNLIIIVDFKSASSLRTKEIIDKYKCQVAAYIIAFEELSGKKVGRGEIWISHKDGLQIETFNGEELEEKKKEFLELCETYHSMWDISPFEEAYLEQKNKDI